MREWGLSKELTQLVVPASARTAPALRLHLQDLQWWLNETNLSFFPKFLSPHLTRIFVTTDTLAGPGESIEPWHELPDEVVPKMCSAIKMFPSSLQCLRIRLGVRPETRLTGEISAFILGCGESFREFSTNLVLSTQAIVHLMRLPNLCEWVTEQGPPRVADLIDNGVPDGVTSLFPSLKALDLRSEVALEWLSLFETKKTNTPPWIMARGSLPTLKYYHPTLPIDSSLVSRLLLFVDLVEVSLGMGCFMRPCVSKFTDQDVERLASALPKLEALTLGRGPCHEDTCPTTVRSLLFLSVHCTKLEHLNIHFRTGNLRGDMVDLLGYAYSQNLHSRPKCALEALVTGQMFLQLDDHDYVLISLGMLMIFPSLVRFTTMCHMWGKMGVVVKTFRQVGRPLEVITDKLMKILNEIREKLENGVPVDSIVSSCLSFGPNCGYVCLLISPFRFDRMRWRVSSPSRSDLRNERLAKTSM